MRGACPQILPGDISSGKFLSAFNLCSLLCGPDRQERRFWGHNDALEMFVGRATPDHLGELTQAMSADVVDALTQL